MCLLVSKKRFFSVLDNTRFDFFKTRIKRGYTLVSIMMRRLAFLFFLFVMVVLSACSKGEPEGAKNDPNAPVSLTLTDEISGETITFKIPPDYLTYEKQKRGELVRGRIWIETGLPDMKPRKAKTPFSGEVGSKEYEKSLREFNNGIFIDIDSSILFHEFFLNVRKRYATEFVSKVSNYEDLVEFQDLFCVEQSCVSRGFEYFLTSDKYSGKAVRFRCITRLENSGCSATTTYRGWSIEYTLRRSELHRWKVFDASVRDLLDTFYVSPKNTATGR